MPRRPRISPILGVVALSTKGVHRPQETTLAKFVTGIWEQIHSGTQLGAHSTLEHWPKSTGAGTMPLQESDHRSVAFLGGNGVACPSDAHDSFNHINNMCRKITQASRTYRSVGVTVQARWVEHFESYVGSLAATHPEMTPAGWAALVLAGMGIYRLCKYRIGLNPESMQCLRRLRSRIERRFTSHPHDWVVFPEGSDPIPRLDVVVGCTALDTCWKCGQDQPDDPKLNACHCFLSLLGGKGRALCPVQIFRTSDGRNNSLQALVAFERGATIGEFVGLVTKGMRDVDVMDSSAAGPSFQIWQGRQGNYTRFVNHSCKPNTQFETFVWMSTQRIILAEQPKEENN
ncbi:hypothetical protein GE09DRAFT_1174493 [Coniochaeta sp. 2T2.1]|nr:hypothetical protein GE09DRAFT_1174493 [Coniochaeta sp. 2T2.1]